MTCAGARKRASNWLRVGHGSFAAANCHTWHRFSAVQAVKRFRDRNWKRTCNLWQAPVPAVMPAEHVETELVLTASELVNPNNSLNLQQAKRSSSPQLGISAANSLTAKGLDELPPPMTCSSPRIQSHPAKVGSRAALNMQASKPAQAKSPAKQKASQSAVRRSADAVLVSSLCTASNLKATAFRQARQRSSMQPYAADSCDDVAAAVRRSRVLSCNRPIPAYCRLSLWPLVHRPWPC